MAAARRRHAPVRTTPARLRAGVETQLNLAKDVADETKNPEYILGISAIWVRYGLATCHVGAVPGIPSDYPLALTQSGVVQEVEEFMRKLVRDVRATRVLAPAVADMVDEFWRTGSRLGPAGDQARIEYDVCPSCGVRMVVDQERSEFRCYSCAMTRRLEGVVYSDAQFYSQDGARSKSGAFVANRYAVGWLRNILALEPDTEIGDPRDPDNERGEKVVAALEVAASTCGFELESITVYQMRDLLQFIGRTDLNKHAALLMKRLTGVGPPVIGGTFRDSVLHVVGQVVEYIPKIQTPDRSNRNYYPFYFYKVIWSLTKEGDPERTILYYIYLQSDDTLCADDDEWKLICERFDFLVPAPTDRGTAVRLFGKERARSHRTFRAQNVRARALRARPPKSAAFDGGPVLPVLPVLPVSR